MAHLNRRLVPASSDPAAAWRLDELRRSARRLALGVIDCLGQALD
jgi:hypothetical protein